MNTNIYVQMNIDQQSISRGVKGIVLILISSLVQYLTVGLIGLNLDLKYLVTISIITDDLCLFLMFNGNESLYKRLCGCLCDKCCISCIYGSKYKQIETLDDDEQDDV